ncbi:hypothetical protein F5X96DRAFT_673570 [Biscogniauxia mediterranea]|nr:hypothetical protein F5X96DRAFT_673570 [Biscogniauxia mediterranea]
MACGSSHCHPVNRNGPGSAASSTFEKIVQPGGGGKSKCIDCGEFECCCIPCTSGDGYEKEVMMEVARLDYTTPSWI